MKLILHPGYGKCGSTTIQKGLSEYRQNLERQRVHLVDREFVRKIASKHSKNLRHLNVLFYLKWVVENDQFDAFKKSIGDLIIYAEKKGFTAILLSSENLSNTNFTLREPRIHKALIELFEDIQVVIYIRRQDQFLISAWKQWHHKEGKSLQYMIQLAKKNSYPNFKLMADFFVQYYGKNNVIIRPLCKETLTNSDLFSDFSSRIGLKLPKDYTPVENVNVSWNFYLYEIMYRLNYLYQTKHDDSMDATLRRQIKSNSLLYKKSKYDLLQPEDSKTVLDHFEQDNRYLHDRFFAEEDFEKIFPNISDTAKSETDKLKEELENLKDVVAIQMEMLLHREIRRTELNNKLKRILKTLRLTYLIKMIKTH